MILQVANLILYRSILRYVHAVHSTNSVPLWFFFLLTFIYLYILIIYIWVLDIHWRFMFYVPEQRYQKENLKGVSISVPHWGGLGNFCWCPFFLENNSEEMSQMKISVEDILGQTNKINNYSDTRTRRYHSCSEGKKFFVCVSGKRSKTASDMA